MLSSDFLKWSSMKTTSHIKLRNTQEQTLHSWGEKPALSLGRHIIPKTRHVLPLFAADVKAGVPSSQQIWSGNGNAVWNGDNIPMQCKCVGATFLGVELRQNPACYSYFNLNLQVCFFPSASPFLPSLHSFLCFWHCSPSPKQSSYPDPFLILSPPALGWKRVGLAVSWPCR